jgi:hypothetical protein
MPRKDQPTEMEDDDEPYRSSLGQAIHLWSNGNDISRTLYKELTELGFDVEQLKYRHQR